MGHRFENSWRMEDGESDRLLGAKVADSSSTDSFTGKPSFIQKFIGILCAFGSVVSISITASNIQMLEKKVPDFETNSFRFGIPLLLCSVTMILTKTSPMVPKKEILSIFFHAVLFLSTSITFYIAINFVPVTSAESIAVTSQIAIGIVIFAIFLKEKITVQRVASALLCVSGVILVLQPEFIFSGAAVCVFSNNTSHPPEIGGGMPAGGGGGAPVDLKTIALGYLFPVADGIATAMLILLTKARPYLKDNSTKIFFWDLVIGTLVSVFVMICFEHPSFPETIHKIVFLILQGFSYGFYWPLLFFASKYVSGNTVSIILNTSAVVLLIPQYTILSNILPGHRNCLEVIGAVLVLGGAVLGSVLELCS